MKALFNAWDRAEGKTKSYCMYNFGKIIFNFYEPQFYHRYQVIITSKHWGGVISIINVLVPAYSR